MAVTEGSNSPRDNSIPIPNPNKIMDGGGQDTYSFLGITTLL